MKRYWTIGLVGAALAAIVAMNIRPYGYNLTSIFHVDEVLRADNPMPRGFVVLQVPSYDGAQYYQIARNMPAIMRPSRWHEFNTKAPGSYAYQRFLLPLAASVVSLGYEAALPYAFLLLNVGALLLSAALMLRKGKKAIYGAALALSPAAIVAMHFTLAEPLTILLITAFLLRYEDRPSIRAFDILLLSLVVLAREVNILFIAYLIGFSLLKRRWLDAAKLLVPTTVFIGLHSMIYAIFDNIPFLISAEAKVFPFSEPVKNILGVYGYDRMSLSSIVLFFGFVLPGILFVCRDIVAKRQLDIRALGALAFFGVMALMPHYIWGSITSIGRVITPVYPLYVLTLAARDTATTRFLAALLIIVGLTAAIGLGLSIHPFTLA